MFVLRNQRVVLADSGYQYTSTRLSEEEINFAKREIVGKSYEDFEWLSYDHQHTFDGGLMNQYIKSLGGSLEECISLQEIEDEA